MRLAVNHQIMTADNIYRGAHKVADTFGIHHERTIETLNVSQQFSTMFRLDVSVPHLKAESTQTGKPKRTSEGIGDISVLSVISPFANWQPEGHVHSFFDKHNLSYIFGMRLPTGWESEEVGPINFDDFNQTGTGTTDFYLGFVYGAPVSHAVRLFVNAVLVAPTGRSTNAGFRPGKEVDASLGAVFSAFGPLSIVTQIDAIGRSRNRTGTNAASRRDSGGTFISAVGGLILSLGSGFGIELRASIPLERRVNGKQLVFEEQYMLGVFWAF